MIAVSHPIQLAVQLPADGFGGIGQPQDVIEGASIQQVRFVELTDKLILKVLESHTRVRVWRIIRIH